MPPTQTLLVTNPMKYVTIASAQATAPHTVQPGGGCAGLTVEEASAKCIVDLTMAKAAGKTSTAKPATSVATCKAIQYLRI
jgi:hypothetical protein